MEMPPQPLLSRPFGDPQVRGSVSPKARAWSAVGVIVGSL
eukprot:COSAG04_NODE_3759_length_2552_cov_2.606925_1_plen_39_part_10